MHVAHVVDVFERSEHAQYDVGNGQLTHPVGEVSADEISGRAWRRRSTYNEEQGVG